MNISFTTTNTYIYYIISGVKPDFSFSYIYKEGLELKMASEHLKQMFPANAYKKTGFKSCQSHI